MNMEVRVEDKSRRLSWPSALSETGLFLSSSPLHKQQARGLAGFQNSPVSIPFLVLEMLKLQVCPIVPSFYVGFVNVCGKHFLRCHLSSPPFTSATHVCEQRHM